MTDLGRQAGEAAVDNAGHEVGGVSPLEKASGIAWMCA
jgi:hypothetical protein